MDAIETLLSTIILIRNGKHEMEFVFYSLLLAYWANGMAVVHQEIGRATKALKTTQNHEIRSTVLRMLLWPMADSVRIGLILMVTFSATIAGMLGLLSLLMPTIWAAGLLALINMLGTVRSIRRARSMRPDLS